MAASNVTIKSVVFQSRDTYRKTKMVDKYKARGMLDTKTVNYLTKGRR